MNKCDYCQHVEMCRWRKELEERGCDFFDDGNKWIPISERLPEDGQSVLFSIKTEKVYSGIYHKNNKINQWNSANHWYLHQDRSGSRNRAVSANIVKAWMPLPAPFEPQESENKG